MSTKPAAPPPLKVEDLMERWAVSRDTVIAYTKDRKLPFWNAGSGGRRIDYRFRLADVEQWEQDQVRVRTPAPAPPVVLPAALPGAWDGVDRLTRARKGR